jgi:hypothetical protein
MVDRMPSRLRAVRQVEDMMATIGTRRSAGRVLGAIALGLLLGSGALAPRGAPATVRCGENGKEELPHGGGGEDLEVVGECIVGGGTYNDGNVNIFGVGTVPGILLFRDAKTTFSAKSILVENNGYLLAGWSSELGKPRPIGTNPGSTLTARRQSLPDHSGPEQVTLPARCHRHAAVRFSRLRLPAFAV